MAEHLEILNPEEKEAVRQIAKIVETKQKFLLTTHVRSDPDGISSELAFYYMLKKLGKMVIIINDAEYPKSLEFLINKNGSNSTSSVHDVLFSAEEYKKNKKKYNFDAVIAFDTPTIERLGKTAEFLDNNVPLINIDHHISNEKFADINLVCSEASSTGEIVYNYLIETKQEITPLIANALYASLITDTGRFIHSNTTAECLYAASDLVKHGARPSEVGKHIYQTNSYSILKLQSMAINTLKMEADNRIAVLWLTNDMLKESGVNDELDTQVFSDIPISVENAIVGIFLKELENSNEIKVSLRSKENIDVNKIASIFGGGGHVKASGCEIVGTISEVHKKVVDEVMKAMQ